MTGDILGIRVPQSWLWAVAYFSALGAMVADAHLKLLDDPWHWLLKVLVVVLVVPFLISARRQAKEEGPVSHALDTLNARVVTGVFALILVFGAGATLYRELPDGSPWLWPLGLATAVPLLFVIWSMGRYLAEERDEYLRHLAVTSALIGLAVVLVFATVWGFLENLGLVPHMWTWLLVPLFCAANGIGRGWLKARR
jgi:hypothetical protein